MKTIRVEERHFACVAEAVAHYFEQGFDTFDSYDNVRMMRNGNREVMITHDGLLDVNASVIDLA